MSWVAVGVAAVSVVGGLIGSNAARKAAKGQEAASREATAEQRRQFDLTRADFAPFLQTGTSANARLAALLGIEPGGTGEGELLRRITQADIEGDPVYQSGLEFGAREGRDAINARAIAGGGYDSGATLKALTRFGTDYGSTKANESYNRFVNDQTNIYNRLAGISGTGQVAANQIGAARSNMADQITDLTTGAGNARAAGIVGSANAWNRAIESGAGAFNMYQNNQILQQLMRNQGGRGGGNFASTGRSWGDNPEY